MLEAICEKCGETYNPETSIDEHYVTFSGQPCGGKPASVRILRPVQGSLFTRRRVRRGR